MGVDAVAFQSAGQRTEHVIPGTYSRTNYVKNSGGGVSANNACIVGESKGGKPNQLYVFYSPSEAKDTLRGGPLLEAILHAFSPGNDLTPQYIGAMRCNVGTQATRTLRKSAQDIISLKAWDWGAHTNQVKMKLEAGSNVGFKVSFAFGGNVSEEDDVTRPSFSILYTGEGSAATLPRTKPGLTTAITGGAGGENLNLDFNSFSTLDDLVGYIADRPGYAISLIGNGTDKTAELDSVTNQDIKGAEYIVKSDLQSIIDTLVKMPYVGSGNAEFVYAAPSRLIPDLDSDWVYFSGGTNGAASVLAFSDTIDRLENEDIQIIGAATSDEGVHILIRNHCINMNSVENRKERSCLLGGALDESVDDTVTRAKNLGSKFCSLAYPGIYTYDPMDYTKKKYGAPYLYAAKLIGQEVSLAINEPMTNKSVDTLAWEKDLKKGDITKLIKAGVTVGGKSQDNRLATIRNLTTHQGSELQCCERSMMREAMYMARDLRNAYISDVGKAGVDGAEGDAAATFWTKVNSWQKQGLIVRDAEGNLAWGLVIRRVGSATFIEFHCYLTAPNNFFFIDMNVHVYEGSDVSVAA
jgi:hypothetical protein